MEIVQVKIKDLKPAEYNPRQMTPEQARQLEESIVRFGFVDPLVVNGNPDRRNVVIGGHQRLKIATNLGFIEVPVVYVDLDLKREQELNLRLNRNLGEWDWNLLANFDKEILIDVGFNSQELDANFQLGEVEEDNFDAQKEYEAIKEPVAKLGDLYQLGRHRLLCGNATKKEDFEKLTRAKGGGEKVDMVFTDPPYNIGWDYDDKSRNRFNPKYNCSKAFSVSVFKDKWSPEEFVDF